MRRRLACRRGQRSVKVVTTDVPIEDPGHPK